MLHTHDVEAGDEADRVGEIEAHEGGVRVVDRGVHDHPAELVPQRPEELADRLTGGCFGGGVRRRAESPQVLGELDAHGLDPRALCAFTELHQVLDRGRRLPTEVREHVAHVDVEVHDRRVLAGDLGDRGRQVGGQEGLPRPPLRGEDREDPPPRQRLPVRLRDVGRAEVGRPDDRALNGVAELLRPLRHVHDVADTRAHRRRQQPVPRVVAYEDHGRAGGLAPDELGQAECVGLLDLGREDQDVDRSGTR